MPSGPEEWTMYRAHSERLGTFDLNCGTGLGPPNSCSYLPVLAPVISLAGKVIWADGAAVSQDRQGTNRAAGRFKPYGDEITASGNDRLKFATYKRDATTGLDSADQRMYASTLG